ncbi:16S rRNA (guanine(966)-N(2))-methyltransferase RsmD [Betaproteobacteria bacterium]|nr:16S rRNA (guanine(966)-N(2))-methyltransferase RsmD [Betaproteobacteria bacterium]
MGNSRNTTRITGGIWKRTIVPVYEDSSVRPTLSRTRETLFNWIRQDIEIAECEVLDLFCGSGVLGLEAMSRGALSACFVDHNMECLAGIAKLLTRLNASHKATLINEEVSSWLGHNVDKKYDLVFLDPPFAFDNPTVYLRQVKHLVKKNGLVYLENKSSTSITLDSEVECWRSASAGNVYYGLYRIL